MGMLSCAEEEETINIKQKAEAKKSFMLFRLQNIRVPCRICETGTLEPLALRNRITTGARIFDSSSPSNGVSRPDALVGTDIGPLCE